ncbi:MAG: endonuclease V [Thermoproteota archaeon]
MKNKITAGDLNRVNVSNVSISYDKLYRIQELLSRRVLNTEGWLERIRRVAGVDVSYRDSLAVVGFSILDLLDNTVSRISVSKAFTEFPYIPSLLCFREGPLILRVLRRFLDEYDLVIVNGHGIAHPRRCGLATYVGVMLNKPTIGVAKEPLGDLNAEHNINDLNKYEDKFYYSIGNMITLEEAYRIISSITKEGFKLPIPLDIAHRFSVKMIRVDC